jgi:hypothetical protein
MIELVPTDDRFRRLARTLDAPESDEVVLLRAARTLKNIYADLTRAVWEQMTVQGRTQRVLAAQAGLKAMEQDLRYVLLDHTTLGTRQMRQHLSHALDQSCEALEMLRY